MRTILGRHSQNAARWMCGILWECGRNRLIKTDRLQCGSNSTRIL